LDAALSGLLLCRKAANRTAGSPICPRTGAGSAAVGAAADTLPFGNRKARRRSRCCLSGWRRETLREHGETTLASFSPSRRPSRLMLSCGGCLATLIFACFTTLRNERGWHRSGECRAVDRARIRQRSCADRSGNDGSGRGRGAYPGDVEASERAGIGTGRLGIFNATRG
jgi:hypothetical protein